MLPLHHGAVRMFPAAIDGESMLERHPPDPRESPTEHKEPSRARALVRGRWLVAPGSNRDLRSKSPVPCRSGSRPSCWWTIGLTLSVRSACKARLHPCAWPSIVLVPPARIRTGDVHGDGRFTGGRFHCSPTEACHAKALSTEVRFRMVRAPEVESGLREWRSHVLTVKHHARILPGRGAQRAGRQQPARRRSATRHIGNPRC